MGAGGMARSNSHRIGKAIKGFKKSVHEADVIEAEAQAAQQQMAAAPQQVIPEPTVQAAAPVVKCLFSALAGQTKPSAVVPSDPIDLNATAVSPIQFLANPLCLSGFGGSVRD